jgi:acetoacetyl-CoA synthetase
MKVQIYSDDGEAIESTGNPGELVCTAPFPSQPAFFWGDESGERYRAAYYERFPGTCDNHGFDPERREQKN